MFDRDLIVLSVKIDEFKAEGGDVIKFANCTAVTSVSQDPTLPTVGCTVATYKMMDANNQTDFVLAEKMRSMLLNAKTMPVTLPVTLAERTAQGKPIIAITGLRV